jgi:hypothetical protein
MPDALKESDDMSEAERQKEIERLNELSDRQKKANVSLRGLYRWVLEFLRNCMVVAAVFYLAEKSGDWWLYGIAGIGSFALAGYCYTYIENWWPNLDVTRKGRLRGLVTIFGSVLVLQLVLAGITVGVMVTLDKIVRLEGQTTKGP